MIAQVDTVEKGYLIHDPQGRFHLPALRKLGDRNSQDVNLLVEYTIHNMSDADFIYTVPVARTADEILRQFAPQFGFNPVDTANYNNHFRNPVLSNLTAEKLAMIFNAYGIEGAKNSIQDSLPGTKHSAANAKWNRRERREMKSKLKAKGQTPRAKSQELTANCHFPSASLHLQRGYTRTRPSCYCCAPR